MNYGVKVAWLKSSSKPKRENLHWRWENDAIISNVYGDVRSVKALIQIVAQKYGVQTVDLKISATYSNSMGTLSESDVVAEIIAPCRNAKTGENWLLIEASELIALIESEK